MIKYFLTENFKFKISAKDATFVKVEPLSKIDDDNNKFPAAIPSSIGWLCRSTYDSSYILG